MANVTAAREWNPEAATQTVQQYGGNRRFTLAVSAFYHRVL